MIDRKRIPMAKVRLRLENGMRMTIIDGEIVIRIPFSDCHGKRIPIQLLWEFLSRGNRTFAMRREFSKQKKQLRFEKGIWMTTIDWEITQGLSLLSGLFIRATTCDGISTKAFNRADKSTDSAIQRVFQNTLAHHPYCWDFVSIPHKNDAVKKILYQSWIIVGFTRKSSL